MVHSLWAGPDRLDGRELVGRDEDREVAVRRCEQDEVDLPVADGCQLTSEERWWRTVILRGLIEVDDRESRVGGE